MKPERRAVLSIDLDEIGCYHRIHGLAPPGGATARVVWDRALERHLALLDSLDVPATFFVVGEDLDHEENVRRLERIVAAGHEVANHTRAHPYDFVRRNREAVHREVMGGLDAIERAVGTRPLGFRAPGYHVSETVFEVLADAGIRYDSSLLPSPPYFAAKAAILGVMRLSGRRSASILGDPRMALARAEPHRLHRTGILEIPIGVVPGLGVPFIGTTFALAGIAGTRWLARAMTLRRFVNVELHGIDLCDAHVDGLDLLRRHQPDLRVPLATKETAIRTAVETLLGRGYRFVRLCDVLVD